MRFKHSLFSTPTHAELPDTPTSLKHTCTFRSSLCVRFRIFVQRWRKNKTAFQGAQDAPIVPPSKSSDNELKRCDSRHARRTSDAGSKIASIGTNADNGTDMMVDSLAESAAIAFTNLVMPTPSPPIVIASVFWTAEARTFIVRVEPEFTVACTVVHPVRRLRFFRLLLSWIHARLARIGTSVRTEKSKNKPANIEIELDDFSDVRGLVAKPPLQEESRQEYQQKTQQGYQEETKQKQQKQQRSSKRNSGWIGVFAGGESENGKASPSFAIDGTNDRLVVPEMDIGVAYFARHEEEDDEISSLKSFCLTID